MCFINDKIITEILHIKKTTKILKKGKLLRFKILVVSGNSKNMIGLGIGKDISFDKAKKKAIVASYKNLKFVNHFYINKKATIPYSFNVKVKKSKILFKPNKNQTGIRSSKLFFVLANLAGFDNLLIKQIKSKNFLNNVYAFFNFLNILNTLTKKNDKLYKKSFINYINTQAKNKVKIKNIRHKNNISFLLRKLPINKIINFL